MVRDGLRRLETQHVPGTREGANWLMLSVPELRFVRSNITPAWLLLKSMGCETVLDCESGQLSAHSAW